MKEEITGQKKLFKVKKQQHGSAVQETFAFILLILNRFLSAD